MKKILVTGITGFIGRNILDSLTNKYGFFVTGIGRKNLDIEANNRFNFIQVNLNNLDEIKFENDYDALIHIAGSNDILSRDFDLALNGTLFTTNNLLNKLVGRVKKIIYFSTAQVYGYQKIVNDETKANPINDYGLTHYYSELLIKKFASINSIDFINLRPTNIFGDINFKTVDRDSLVPACFCKSVVNNSEIQLNSSGKQYRNFLFTSSIADCLNAIISSENLKDGPESVILSSNLNLRIVDVAFLVAEIYQRMTGIKANIRLPNKNICGTNEIEHEDQQLPEYNSKYLDTIGFSSSSSNIESFSCNISNLINFYISKFSNGA